MIIAFGHRRYVGKNLAAKLLYNYLRLNGIKSIQQVSFATPLKQLCRDLFPGIKDTIYYEQNPKEKDEVIEEYGYSARSIWIAVGNNMRDIDPLVWISKTLDVSTDHLIIRDLRYDNEASTIKELGGVLVRIDRDTPKHTDVADTALSNYTDWDEVIDNNGTIYDLQERIVELAERYFLNG